MSSMSGNMSVLVSTFAFVTVLTCTVIAAHPNSRLQSDTDATSERTDSIEVNESSPSSLYEAKINPCDSKPCLNGGICIRGEGRLDYTCYCTYNYSGRNCEKDCNCKGGKCVRDEKTNQMVCGCKPGQGWFNSFHYDGLNRCGDCECGENWKGKFGCTFHPDSKYHNKKCICPTGYFEVDGECKEIDPCDFNPCQNGGICIREGGLKYTCNCLQGYSGLNCEKNCYCQGGKCVIDEKTNQLVCSCKPGQGWYHENGRSSVNACRDCECGENFDGKFNCTFASSNWGSYKKCLCPTGYSLFEGKCNDCECGENSKGKFDCNFISYPWLHYKECICPAGYSQFKRKCGDCECGENVNGKFDCKIVYNNSDAYKLCLCPTGYVYSLFDGKCKDCECGENSNGKFDCKFSPYSWSDNKECICPPGYLEVDGKCKDIINPCDPNPCPNGGSCRREGASNYRCREVIDWP